MTLVDDPNADKITPKDVFTYFIILAVILLMMYLYDKVKGYAKKILIKTEVPSISINK